MQYVYVLNKHGEHLMPCSLRKARLLLKEVENHCKAALPIHDGKR